MRQQVTSLRERESGAQLVEWIIVTLILILAMFAILQVVGSEVEGLLEKALEFINSLAR